MEVEEQSESKLRNVACGPVQWLKMLASELHWTFVFGVVTIYGINQGFGYSFGTVATEYYMKDVQKVQPSEYQSINAITKIPWIIKPLWGILTDVFPISGFHRRPYFILAGVLGVVSFLSISLQSNLHLYLAILLMTISSVGMAIADVTIDACTAYNSEKHKSLASDMQSLCSLSTSVGALVGFFMSGILIHLVGFKGVFDLLTFPFALVTLVGIVFVEDPHEQEFNTFTDAWNALCRRMKRSEVWCPSLYMYISFAFGVNIHEGLFYWFTDSKDGPSFAQDTVGFISSIGSIGSIIGTLLYQLVLKDHPFRSIFMWTQILFALSGMFDLIFLLRLNLKFGLPDYLFILVDGIVHEMIDNLKWMSINVLANKLFPHGIEGTFFALLMSIANLGVITSNGLGGILLHVLKVTRTEFGNLWLAVLARNVMRLLPLFFLFLVPEGNPETFTLPNEINGEEQEAREVEMAPLLQSDDRRITPTEGR